LISAVDPAKWNKKTYWYYMKRYCSVSNNGYGMNYKGAGTDDKLNELQDILRQRCMIRRLKKDVLTELPPKIRQVVELEWNEDDNDVICAMRLENAYLKTKAGSDNAIELAVRAELAKASESDDEYKAAIEAIGERVKISFEEMAEVRHDTAVAKIPYCIDYIETLLESGQKIIIMAHHHDVVHAFAKKWPLESVTITGETKLDDRQNNVDRFQNDENCKLAICFIKAAGVGITLTAASTVVFVELDWIPGNITQAEDRAHRIGQSDTVNVYHLVLKESIDVNMARTLIDKQKVIEAALDKTLEKEPVILTRDNAATKNTSRAKIAEQATKITNWQILYVHQALKFLANDDGDYAKGLNGIGYNKIDSGIGH
jgi:SNF2 family DNA or RNA helicase